MNGTSSKRTGPVWRRLRSVGPALAAVVGTLAGTAGAAVFLPGPAVAAPAVVTPAAWRADPVAGAGLPDPATAPPAAVARFFAGLPAAERAALAAGFPDVVGNLDGAPPALRYAANRQRMIAAGAPYRDWALAGRQFLVFDPRGDGRIAEVLGDLDTADRIAVLVPGVDDRPENFTRGLGGVAERAPAVQAGALHDAARARDPHVAVVAWLGYQTPRGIRRDALREELAAAGAPALDRLTDGLAARTPAARITVVGHSYGSVVAGLAAHDMPAQVTDIVAVGSPGMGVPDAAGLHHRARVWAALSDADPMRFAPGVRVLGVGHDTAPTAPGFGATRLDTTGVTDHDRYLSPGTGSLAAIAAVTTDGTTGTEKR